MGIKMNIVRNIIGTKGKRREIRTAKVILHRKIDNRGKCVCGEQMTPINHLWCCPRQNKLDEPREVIINIPSTKYKKP